MDVVEGVVLKGPFLSAVVDLARCIRSALFDRTGKLTTLGWEESILVG